MYRRDRVYHDVVAYDANTGAVKHSTYNDERCWYSYNMVFGRSQDFVAFRRGSDNKLAVRLLR